MVFKHYYYYYFDLIKENILIAGNYSVAHSVLLGMCMDLHDNGLPIIIELMSLLTLLHSYRLVRLHVKLGHHYTAARMLLRVSDNVSKFPARKLFLEGIKLCSISFARISFRFKIYLIFFLFTSFLDVVPILTSTVIECHRADLKGAAFNYAAMLMKPEYKSKVSLTFVNVTIHFFVYTTIKYKHTKQKTSCFPSHRYPNFSLKVGMQLLVHQKNLFFLL